MTKRVACLIAPLAVAAALSGCALHSPSIAELKYNPGRYQNKTVAINGVVTSSWGVPLMPFKLYKVDDGTGEVTVIAQNGRTAIPSGARVWGHVSGVTAANNATETAALVLDFDSLTFGARTYPYKANIVATNLMKQGASTSETVKSAAIGAAAGAVLGAVLSGADRDKILLGGGLGAVAGTAISLGKGGENAVLPAGSHLSVQTTQTVALRY